MLFRGAMTAGLSRATATRVAGIFGTLWAAWVLVSVLLAKADLYRFEPTRPVPWLPIGLMGALAAALLLSRIPVVSRILAQPDALWRLTVPQIFRVVGVTFLIVLALGKLPAVFALPAGLGDIAIGVEAVFVARNLRRGVAGRRPSGISMSSASSISSSPSPLVSPQHPQSFGCYSYRRRPRRSHCFRSP